jgi:thymidylate kinase
MMKKPKRIAVIGIDGSGKDIFAKTLFENSRNAALVKLTEYGPENRLFRALGKIPNKLIETGERTKSKKLIVAGYAGHALLFGPYRIKKEKRKEKIFFVRYPPYDAEALSKVYGKGKASSLIKKIVKVASASPRPDEIYLMEVEPKVAMDKIKQRGKPIQMHENKESLTKLAQEYEKVADRLAKKGVKIYKRRVIE